MRIGVRQAMLVLVYYLVLLFTFVQLFIFALFSKSYWYVFVPFCFCFVCRQCSVYQLCYIHLALFDIFGQMWVGFWLFSFKNHICASALILVHWYQLSCLWIVISTKIYQIPQFGELCLLVWWGFFRPSEAFKRISIVQWDLVQDFWHD